MTLTVQETQELGLKTVLGLLERLGSSETARVDERLAQALPDHVVLTLRRRGLFSDNPDQDQPSAQETTVKPDLSRKLVDIDTDLRGRLQVAANAAMKRTLERAGAKIVTKARTAAGAPLRAFVDAPLHRVLGAVPLSLLAASGLNSVGLIDTSFDDLHEQFDRWVSDAQAAAAKTAAKIVGHDPATAAQALAPAQSIARTQAWIHLQRALQAQAYDLVTPAPSPNANDTIPSDALDPDHLVPVDLLRSALALAGGVAVGAALNAKSQPVGQIGTGDIVSTYLENSGANLEHFQWVHGPSVNPFPPHEELDGVQFQNFDDPVLANNEDWPNSDFFFPGQFPGCICDFIQVWSADS